MREAQCRCGGVKAACEGAPVRVSVCHCLQCQRRSGSAFATQARFPVDQVRISGEMRTWSTRGESGNLAHFHFCPTCGSPIAYELEVQPGLIAIPVGAFADPEFDTPRFSVWEERKHPWVAILGENIERD